MCRALTTITLALATAAAAACGSTSSNTVAGPSPAKCQLAATNSTPSFNSSGGSGTINVVAARECAWSAAVQVSWLTLAPPTDGQGEATLKYTVQANPSGVPRRGSVNVGGQFVEVGQEGAPCRFEVDRTRLQVAAEATTFQVNVQGPTGCSWTAASEAEWLVISQGAQGTGPGRATVSVSSNPGPTRTGSVIVAGVRVDVTQAAVGSAPPPQPGCTFNVSPKGTIVADASGATGTIDVTATAGCAWTATSPDSWIHLSSAGGTGDGQVTYDIAANTSIGRTGSITVAGTTLNVTQSGSAPPPPTITVSGTVTGLSGSCPVTTFTVDGQVVVTSAATSYKSGSCGKLKDGENVTVRGLQAAAGGVDAIEVDFDK
jgi:Domain of unknown function (DUF5666)/Putative binding domain, N-terminal/Viral BACON domain